MSTPKIVVDLTVIPEGWSLDDFKRVADEKGLVVIDTHRYNKSFSPVKVLDENMEIITIEEYQNDN